MLTWNEFNGWPDRFDLHQLAAELTDEQITTFHTMLHELHTFAKQLDAAREEVLIEQRGRPMERRSHLRAL